MNIIFSLLFYTIIFTCITATMLGFNKKILLLVIPMIFLSGTYSINSQNVLTILMSVLRIILECLTIGILFYGAFEKEIKKYFKFTKK